MSAIITARCIFFTCIYIGSNHIPYNYILVREKFCYFRVYNILLCIIYMHMIVVWNILNCSIAQCFNVGEGVDSGVSQPQHSLAHDTEGIMFKHLT